MDTYNASLMKQSVHKLTENSSTVLITAIMQGFVSEESVNVWLDSKENTVK